MTDELLLPAPPPPSSEAVRRVMQGNVRRDTRPERALRSALHRLGLRYRVDFKLGAGRAAPRPDVAFIRAQVAVFVDGCFWHGCPEHGVKPRANAEYWMAKVARNRRRDERNDATLEALGWRVIRVWEHENPSAAAVRIERVVKDRIGSAPSSPVARMR